ncbi:hypothetical protein FS749_013859 [Ceratobasidium sp. UAMH 11750]|nr:hypothetical protein FS749_013859 [Ceratobasidium sp. UAMH 11750]
MATGPATTAENTSSSVSLTAHTVLPTYQTHLRPTKRKRTIPHRPANRATSGRARQDTAHPRTNARAALLRTPLAEATTTEDATTTTTIEVANTTAIPPGENATAAMRLTAPDAQTAAAAPIATAAPTATVAPTVIAARPETATATGTVLRAIITRSHTGTAVHTALATLRSVTGIAPARPITEPTAGVPLARGGARRTIDGPVPPVATGDSHGHLPHPVDLAPPTPAIPDVPIIAPTTHTESSSPLPSEYTSVLRRQNGVAFTST